MAIQPNASSFKPPLTRLIWLIYNNLGMREPHPKPLSNAAKATCRNLQLPYWQQRRKDKYGI